MCTQSSCDHIKALVGNRMNELVRQWNTEGIIYEGDFNFSAAVIDHEWKALLKVLEDAGCKVSGAISTAVDMGKEGWMYAGVDLSRYELKEAEKMIRRKFSQENP